MHEYIFFIKGHARLQSSLVRLLNHSANFPIAAMLLCCSTSSLSMNNEDFGRRIRYVGLLPPQLVASTTWDLRRLRYIASWSLQLCETCGRFSYVGLVVASDTWDLWSPPLRGTFVASAMRDLWSLQLCGTCGRLRYLRPIPFAASPSLRPSLSDRFSLGHVPTLTALWR